MKKKVYRVRTQYVFEGVFDVVAESKEDARQKVLQNCGLVMGGSIHSTLPDDEINFSSNALNNSWAFNKHPNTRIDRITKVQKYPSELQQKPRKFSVCVASFLSL